MYAMEQPNFASYVPSSYPNMMDLPSHVPFHRASNSSTTPNSCQQSFDESSCVNTTPQELSNVAVSRLAEGSLDQWLMDTASPESSRVSTSPSQGVATPPSDGFYSPPYPEQLQLPAYELLEQPQPLRTCSTSHPNWMNSADNWQRNYAEGDIWGAQSFVAQPWIPDSYEGYAAYQMDTGHAHAGNEAHLPFIFPGDSQFHEPQIVQTRLGMSNNGSEDSNEDEDSDSDDSDWDEEVSNISQAGGSASKPKSKPKPRSPHMQVDRWTVNISNIKQSEPRGYVCNVPNCNGTFLRPEHLRRHFKSKHEPARDYVCKVPGCTTTFSRGDNLRSHYWTHLDRGGRAGKNKKMTLPELKVILGPREKKLVRYLREKQKAHMEKQKRRPTYTERSKL